MNRTLLLASMGLLVGGLLSFQMYRREFHIQRGGGELREVVSAAVDIPLGQPVRREWLTTESIPSTYVEERHLSEEEGRDLVGLPLAQSVRAGETILRTDLSTRSDARRTLSGSIPSGMRALTIMARSESTFGGLLRPGDRVDVLLSVRNRETDAWQSVVVVENLLVLAVGQEYEVRNASQEAQATRGGRDPSQRQSVAFGRASNITVQVTIEQGALVTIARQQGTLGLILRNPNDLEVSPSRPDVFEQDALDVARRQRFLHRAVTVAPMPAPGPSAAAVVPAAVDPSAGDSAIAGDPAMAGAAAPPSP